MTSVSKSFQCFVFFFRISKGDEECLKEIFKRIGQKETTKQGLQDLYNFKQRNPHADRQLEPFLVRPDFFVDQSVERPSKVPVCRNSTEGSNHERYFFSVVILRRW